jgi:hypothetical protein
MNELNLHPMAYYFPYCALAANYKKDSGDEDKDFSDFVRDCLAGWNPGCEVHEFFDERYLDYSFAIEDESVGELLIVALGTEGKATGPGWVSDLSPGLETGAFKELRGHVDFIRAGMRIFDHCSDLIDRYSSRTTLTGHSRGSARIKGAARQMFRDTGEIPRVWSYCSPPVFNHDGAKEYDACGLGGATTEVVSPHDLVDNIGLPILHHVGTSVILPDAHAKITESVPVIGHLVLGHAYSAVFACLKKYFSDRGMEKEVEYLQEKEWVCTI